MSLSSTYREHMRRYAMETAVMSFTVHNHPDYQALVAMGDDIIPLLIADIRKLGDPEDSTDWRDMSFWGAVSLLAEILGDDRPEIPEESRGRYDDIRKIYLDWYDRRPDVIQAVLHWALYGRNS